MSGLNPPSVLHPDWYVEVPVLGVLPHAPGIYEWRIEGVGCYIGRYTHVRRPRREYGLNVGKLLEGRPYRKSKPDSFRPIHRALHRAVLDRRAITLTLLENEPDEGKRHARERELILARRTMHHGTGYQVFNSN